MPEAESPNVYPNAVPLGVWGVFAATVKTCRTHAAFLSGLALLTVVPRSITAVFLEFTHPFPAWVDDSPLPFLAGFAALLPYMLVDCLTYPVAYGAAGWGVTEMCRGNRVSLPESIRRACGQYGRLFLAGILYQACILFGLLYCILPGIWLVIIWMPLYPVFMNEKTRITEAFTRSVRLMNGYVLGTSFSLFAVAMPCMACSIALQYASNRWAFPAFGFVSGVVWVAFVMALSSVVYVAATDAAAQGTQDPHGSPDRDETSS